MMGTIALGYLFTTVVVAAIVDSRHLLIPNTCTAALIAGGLLHSWLAHDPGLTASLMGLLVGGGALALVSILFERARGRTGLGFGDVKFVAGAGTWVGWQGLAPLVLTAAVGALAYVTVRRLASSSYDLSAPVPFAPFLGCATVAVWLAQAHGFAPWLVMGEMR